MNKYILLILLNGTLLSACAQKIKNTDVPTAVAEAFFERFPDVKKAAWSKENDSEYEAEFKTKGDEQSANFDTSGNWLETETEIKKSDVPSNLRDLLSKEFPGYEIEEAELTETKDKGTYYEFEIEKDEASYEVSISKDGEILKKEERKEGKGDKD